MKIIAPLILSTALISLPSHAQADHVVLHCEIKHQSGKEKSIIVRIDKSNGNWDEWNDDRQQFMSSCPFESESTKATCIISNARFGWQQVIEGELIIGATVSRESGRYEFTSRHIYTVKDLIDSGLGAQPDAKIESTGICNPGEAPKPRVTRF